MELVVPVRSAFKDVLNNGFLPVGVFLDPQGLFVVVGFLEPRFVLVRKPFVSCPSALAYELAIRGGETRPIYF